MYKPTGNDLWISDELKNEFIELANYSDDKRIRAMLSKFVETPVNICKELNVNPRIYVKAVLAHQAPPNSQPSFMPWQLSPPGAKTYVQEYISVTGKRDLDEQFKTQCRILGVALSNSIPDYVCLGDQTNDFYPWFRILMTEKPNKEIIAKYSSKVLDMLKHDFELEQFLKNFESAGNKLDLTRITGYKYE